MQHSTGYRYGRTNQSKKIKFAVSGLFRLSGLASLIAESVAKLGVNLARIVPVKPSKCQTVIQLHAAVG